MPNLCRTITLALPITYKNLGTSSFCRYDEVEFCYCASLCTAAKEIDLRYWRNRGGKCGKKLSHNWYLSPQ